MKKIIYGLLIMLLLTGCSVKPVAEVTDADKFATEYNITKANPFTYVTANEAIDFLKEGTGIIFFGFPECPWCQAAVKIFNDVLNSHDINEVFYCNIKNDRNDNTAEYQEIVKLLGDNLYEDSDGNHRVYVPDFYFLINGKIVGHNNDMSTLSGEVDEYLTTEKKQELKEAYTRLVVKVYSSDCEGC